jgi:hypothetical protein
MAIQNGPTKGFELRNLLNYNPNVQESRFVPEGNRFGKPIREDSRGAECELTTLVSETVSESKWVETLAAGALDLFIPPYSERVLLPVMEHSIASDEGRFLHAAC